MEVESSNYQKLKMLILYFLIYFNIIQNIYSFIFVVSSRSLNGYQPRDTLRGGGIR